VVAVAVVAVAVAMEAVEAVAMEVVAVAMEVVAAAMEGWRLGALLHNRQVNASVYCLIYRGRRGGKVFFHKATWASTLRAIAAERSNSGVSSAATAQNASISLHTAR
jgi:hypothetical protein